MCYHDLVLLVASVAISLRLNHDDAFESLGFFPKYWEKWDPVERVVRPGALLNGNRDDTVVLGLPVSIWYRPVKANSPPADIWRLRIHGSSEITGMIRSTTPARLFDLR